MDIIRAMTEVDIQEISAATKAAFRPIHQKNRALIEGHPKRTFRFGETDRHQLDIYFPTKPFTSSSRKVPILFWVYGGSFIHGARTLLAPDDLIYNNVGKYFADQGFLTIIADYQLAPAFQYPVPLKDIVDAVKWVIEHPQELAWDPAGLEGDTDSIFLLGHSAGASHVISALLHPDIGRSEAATLVRPHLKGVILFSGPYELVFGDHDGWYHPICNAFWGSVEAARRCSALALLRAAASESDEWGIAELPDVMFLEVEKEPPWLRTARISFVGELEKRGVKGIEVVIAKEHNHSSPPAALGTGAGEEWAEEVVAWVRKRME